jgi:hypothetical protein
MADPEAGNATPVAERQFDTELLQRFMKEKDEVAGFIEEIQTATQRMRHLLEESKQAFDPDKDREISSNLKRVTMSASGYAKKAKVRACVVRRVRRVRAWPAAPLPSAVCASAPRDRLPPAGGDCCAVQIALDRMKVEAQKLQRAYGNEDRTYT